MYTEEHFWAYKMLNFKAVWLQQKKATVLHCIINQKVFKISFFFLIITHLIHSGGKNRYFLCTRTHRHTSIKSFGLSQQELHFDVCHIRQGPRLKSNKLHCCHFIWTFLQLSYSWLISTQNLPQRDTSTQLQRPETLLVHIKINNRNPTKLDVHWSHLPLLSFCLKICQI